MRGLMVVLALLGGLAGCSTGRDPGQPRPAPTPADAYLRPMRALANADEAAYHTSVVYRPPDRYARAQARSQLAHARLHRAAAKRNMTATGGGGAGPGADASLPAGEPPARPLADAEASVRGIEWKVEGDVATPAGLAPSAAPSPLRVERLGGGWIVVASDAFTGASETECARLARHMTILGDAAEAAAALVRAGRLRTVREINDFYRGRIDEAADRGRAEMAGAPPRGPVVVVTDAETAAPVPGAWVTARFRGVTSRLEEFTATTDRSGRARLKAEPHDVGEISVDALGYAGRVGDVRAEAGAGGAPDELQVTVAKPLVVEVTLVLPDDRNAVFSVFEGKAAPPRAGVPFRGLDPKTLTVPVEWGDRTSPAQAGAAADAPAVRVDVPAAGPHAGRADVQHRVTAARTAAGRELPVFRDMAPPLAGARGLYDIGVNASGDRVFVVGTLFDARAAERTLRATGLKRNTRVLGPPMDE